MGAGPLRLALLGCGFHGRHLAAAIADTAGCRLAVCCDPDIERAQALAASLAHPAVVIGDADAAIRHPHVDAVVIATTTHTHLELALASSAARRHVLLEKPMAATTADCSAIERSVAGQGVVLMVGYKFRFAPAVLAAKSLVPRPVVVVSHTMYDAEQRRLEQDRGGRKQRPGHGERTDRCGKDVFQRGVQAARAEPVGRLHELDLTDRDRHVAHQAARHRPLEQHDHEDDARDVLTEPGHEEDDQHERRERQDHLDQPHDDPVDGIPPVTGERAEDHSCDNGGHGGRPTDGERDAPPYSTRASTSRPTWSVPNQWLDDGG